MTARDAAKRRPPGTAPDGAAPGAKAELNIRDVARMAGVSAATVSRALRGMPNVDARTRDHVVAVARRLNYAVSPAASRLATGRTGTIGIVTPFVGRWYFTEVFAGVEEGLKQYDMDLLLHVTEALEQPERVRPHVRMRRRVDGALVIGMSTDQEDMIGLSRMGVPVVLLGAASSVLPAVCIDDRASAGMAVAHLISGGHERIGLITGRELPTQILPENDRLAGYLDELAAHDLAAPKKWRAVGEFTSSGGERAMNQLMSRSPRPTAVFCMSDEMAYGALRALRRAGVSAGGRYERGEMAVIGFDGHDLADVFDLSTIAQPVRELGRMAAQRLMETVRGSNASTGTGLAAPLPVVATSLVVRASTARE